MKEDNDQKINQHTIVTQVMNRIKEAIASGQYRPGDRLPSEAELTKMYGVGRSSVREAIKIFQHLGVVESRPAKGTVVCERAHISVEAITWAVLLGNDDLRDVLDLREAIERNSFARFTEALGKGDFEANKILEDIGSQVNLMLDAVKSNNIEQMINADYKFHGLIVKASRNELFRDLYQNLNAFMQLATRTAYNEMGDLNSICQLHVNILNALHDKTASDSQKQHLEHFKHTRKLLKLNDF